MSAGDSAEKDGSALGRVGVVKREVVLSPAVEKPAPPDPRSDDQPMGRRNALMAGGKKELRKMKRVFIVEDANLLRRIVKDLLSERNLFDEVIDCEDGESFVEAYAKSLADGIRPGLVVLDINMPRLDGMDAALAMRAIETAMNVKRRTPILFFSTRVSDEAFKAFLREIGSARYIRKGEDGDSERLGSRLLTVLERLLGG
jgi:CheY-like chemotaxis protein